jgi:WD40 repeat protein
MSLVTTNGTATVRIWNLGSTGKSLADYREDGTVRPVAFSADGSRLAIRTCGGKLTAPTCEFAQIEVRDLVLSGGKHWTFGVEGFNVLTLALSADGTRLAAGLCPTAVNQFATCDAAEVRVWDLNQPEPIPRSLENAGPRLSAQAFSPDGRYLVAAGLASEILLWDLTGDNLPKRLEGQTGRVRSVAIDPMGQWIASGSDDGSVRLRNFTQIDEPSFVVGSHPDWVWSVTFDRAGTRLATTGKDGSVRVWDPLKPGVPLMVLKGHNEWVNSVAFNDDGTALASASDDGSVRLWNLNRQGRDPVVLDLSTDQVWLVVFEPGQAVAVASTSQGALFVIPTTDRLAELVCERVDRNLTPGEWSNLVGSELPYQLTCADLASGEFFPDEPRVPADATPVALGTPIVEALTDGGSLRNRSANVR